MDDRLHLHEGERLLLTVHASAGLFVRDVLRSILEATFAGAVLSVAGSLFLNLSVGVAFAASALLLVVLLVFLRHRHWRHASLRITTERILLQSHGSLLSHPLHTIKWIQYQESLLGPRSPLDLLMGLRTIVIRYGNADSKLYVSFPGLRFGNDIKHFLDKVDSAVRRNQTDQVHDFVFKKRGQRDEP